MSFVFASRREPPVRLARLRSLGEVGELRTDDLRFDASETERLFRETYEMRLEPGVLVELRRRTEGWAASLQLVRAALHDRNAAQIRTFISSLSGAEGHLYEYLAEEVVGELPMELQQFLMQTAVLETVDLVLGPVAADVDVAKARELIEEGERHGLFGKAGPNTRHHVRAHPLVRDFLQDRLSRTIGADGVRSLHLRVAIAAERTDWRIAARHYLAAADEEAAMRVLTGAIESILATGAYSAAQELAEALPTGELPGAAGLVLRSRIAQQRAAVDEALALAEEAWAEEPESSPVLLNLATARMLAGDISGAVEAGRLLERVTESQLAAFGRAYRFVADSSLAGSLRDTANELRVLANSLRDSGKMHFLGVTRCTEALVLLPMGEPERALQSADEAIALLAASSAGVELVSAQLARASALAQLRDLDGARAELDDLMSRTQRGQEVEVAAEAAEIEEFFGRPTRALNWLSAIDERIAGDADNGDKALLARGIARSMGGDIEGGASDISRVRAGVPRSTPGFETRRLVAVALLASLRGDADARARASIARTHADDQGAGLWKNVATLLAGMASGDPSRAITDIAVVASEAISVVAEVVCRHLAELSPDAVALVTAEAMARPDRWREPLRRAISGHGQAQLAAASLLEKVGEHEDIARLRRIARANRDTTRRQLGRELARRLAPRIFIDDLGRIRIQVGERSIDGTDVRRKVLALLAFLLTRQRWTASRDEVVDSLWPDVDPQAALNSLNQTVYFLRRLFEPDYREETSPGYVDQDGEAIWLDEELIEARSALCLGIIRGAPGEPDPEASMRLAHEYRGRFALDFLYEDWASPYRDALHAGYLRVVEASLRLDIDSGQYVRAMFLAERATEVEPDSEELQLGLVRIYRLAGARAAAAEQYGHYAKTMRDLGVDPLPFADL